MRTLLTKQELEEFIQSEVGPSASGTGTDALNSILGVYDKIRSDDAIQYLANCFLFGFNPDPASDEYNLVTYHESDDNLQEYMSGHKVFWKVWNNIRDVDCYFQACDMVRFEPIVDEELPITEKLCKEWAYDHHGECITLTFNDGTEYLLDTAEEIDGFNYGEILAKIVYQYVEEDCSMDFSEGDLSDAEQSALDQLVADTRQKNFQNLSEALAEAKFFFRRNKLIRVEGFNFG